MYIRVKKLVGIYEILNTINGKRYIGQSVNIKSRIRTHKYLLRQCNRSKDCNRHLYNSVEKYGISNFKFNIIELCDISELDCRELYWINYFNTLNRDYGYNLRTDYGGRGFVHPETVKLIRENNLGSSNPNYGNKWGEEKRKRMSEIKKNQYINGDVKVDMDAVRKGIEAREKLWKDNPQLKKLMTRRVSDSLRKYNIAKLDYDTLDIVEVYEGRLDILEKHPDYYVQAILGCCSGTKNSYKGFKWKYVDRYEDK